MAWTDYRDKLKSNVDVETPFTTAELTDTILDRAIEKAFSDINKYRPKIVKLASESKDPKYRFIRVYGNEYDATSIIPYFEELGEDIGRTYLYATDWDEDNIESAEKPTRSFFGNLVIGYSMMYMANVRRTADMPDLPFGIKGDDFYQEGKDMVDSQKETLINTMTNTY